MRARLHTVQHKLASLLPEWLEAIVRRHYEAWWKFTAVGTVLTAAQVFLQHIEIAHGWSILWLSPIQGTVLANIGLVVNRYWTFRERHLPWAGIIVCWNLQKVPHSLLSWAVFALLLQAPFMAYWAATLLTAGLIWLGSFYLAQRWSLRSRTVKTETA